MQRRVILYGNSVVLAAIGASLEQYPELQLLAFATPLPHAAELSGLAPDVIFFDTGSTQAIPRALLTLLQECPDLLLVGVNPENAHLLLWSSGRCDAVTAEDLLHVIVRSPCAQEGDH
jgi:hypothetical protein